MTRERRQGFVRSVPPGGRRGSPDRSAPAGAPRRWIRRSSSSRIPGSMAPVQSAGGSSLRRRYSSHRPSNSRIGSTSAGKTSVLRTIVGRLSVPCGSSVPEFESRMEPSIPQIAEFFAVPSDSPSSRVVEALMSEKSGLWRYPQLHTIWLSRPRARTAAPYRQFGAPYADSFTARAAVSPASQPVLQAAWKL